MCIEPLDGGPETGRRYFDGNDDDDDDDDGNDGEDCALPFPCSSLELFDDWCQLPERDLLEPLLLDENGFCVAECCCELCEREFSFEKCPGYGFGLEVCCV